MMTRFNIRWTFTVATTCVALLGSSVPGSAKTCTAEQLGAAVDNAGAALRAFNKQASPKLSAKMQQLRLKKGWSETDYREKIAGYLHDDRIAGFDAKANDLLTKVDEMGPGETSGAVDCARVADLSATGIELLAVMKAKTSYTLTKIDGELKPPRVAAKPKVKAVAQPAKPAKPVIKPAWSKTTGKKPSAVSPGARDVSARGAWQTDTQTAAPPARRYDRGADIALNSEPQPGIPYVQGPGPGAEKGYDIDEIRLATRGFFGTISTSLASVIEYAFKSWGRPSAYVLGNEGGGAFLAGLRYGKGTLYRREGGRQPIFWHGPSVGYDIGAEGSRTMFLIYNLNRPEDIYRSFTGIDGSAYLVGGVGMAFLKGGRVVMAPIRSGVGLRLGANIGYLRFTPKETWNPF